MKEDRQKSVKSQTSIAALNKVEVDAVTQLTSTALSETWNLWIFLTVVSQKWKMMEITAFQMFCG